MLSGWLVTMLSIHDIWQLGFAWVAIEIAGINSVHSTLSSKDYLFFPGPLAFCKKAVERVSSEKNILNSSVECVEWSGVEWSGFF